MLMVTTSMGMLYGVHSNTSNSGPFKFLGVGLEVSIASLQEWLVGSLSTSNNSNHTSAGSLDCSSDS